MAGNPPRPLTIAGSLRTVDGKGVVRIKARLQTGIDDLWSALTDRSRLALWLGDFDGDLRLGGEYRARYFASGWEGSGRVDVCEPPRRLRVLTRSPDEPDGIVEVTLTADGEQTTLVVEDGGLPLEQIAAYGAGNQIHVEDLAAFVDGRGRCDAQGPMARTAPGLSAAGGGDRLTAAPVVGGPAAGQPSAWTRFAGLPATKYSMLSTSWSASACCASSEAHATCGVRMTLGRPAMRISGSSGAGGSPSATSKPAPRDQALVERGAPAPPRRPARRARC